MRSRIKIFKVPAPISLKSSSDKTHQMARDCDHLNHLILYKNDLKMYSADTSAIDVQNPYIILDMMTLI